MSNVTSGELRSKVHQLELRARKIMSHVAPGAYRTAFRAKGVEFEEIREYIPGDDVRAIDWNVTAKLGRPHVKRFAEERELTLMFLVDASRSTLFGAKCDAIAELFAVLALSAVGNGDEVGMILFTDTVEQYFPPGKGMNHVQRMIREVVSFTPRGTGSNLAGALDFLMRIRRKRSFVFLISDYLAGDFKKSMGTCASRHDLVAVSVFDAREETLPDCGLVQMEDSETGRSVVIDTSDVQRRVAFASAAAEHREHLTTLFRSLSVDHLRVEAGSNFVPQLARFLRAHGS